jgi:hypothetical protein
MRVSRVFAVVVMAAAAVLLAGSVRFPPERRGISYKE